MLQRFPLLEAASLKAIPFFRQCCSLGFVLSLYGLCCWHHLSICATNSSKIAEIKLILFLRLFSEFPGDFLVTLWEWREKRQGIYIYMVYIPTGAHLSASGKLYQLENLKLDFALISPESVMPAVPKRRDLVPSLQNQTAQPVLQELESFWWGPGKESSDGAAGSEVCEKWDWGGALRVWSGWGTILVHRILCLLPQAFFVQMQPYWSTALAILWWNWISFSFFVIICRRHGNIY